jgi:tRNA(adenine34) deaminase
MRLALQQAQLAFEAGEVPIGAVLVVNSEVAAAAYNLTETKQNPLSHAELLCISAAADQQLAWRLQEAILYSTIEPCPMCAGAILQARLARLVYGAKQPRCGADGSWVSMFPRQQQEQQQRQQAGGQGCCQAAQLQQTDPVDHRSQQADLQTHQCPPPQALQEQQQQQPQSQQSEKQQHQALQPIGPHPFHPNIQVTGGVLEEECAALMRAFFRNRRREQRAQQQQPSLHHMAVEAQQQAGDEESDVAACCS